MFTTIPISTQKVVNHILAGQKRAVSLVVEEVVCEVHVSSDSESLSVPPLWLVVYRENLMKMDLLVPGPDERGWRMMFRLLLILCLGHCLPAVLGADSSFNCHIRHTVTLPCDEPAATEEVVVLWMFEGKLACSYKNGNQCEFGHYVNRTQLGSIRQNNFSLVINHVKKEDEGEYECRINDKLIRITRLNVDGGRKPEDAVMPPGDQKCRPYSMREDPPESENKDKQDSDENLSGASSGGNSAVIGVIVGLVVLLGAVAVAAVFTKRLRNRQRNNLSKRVPCKANII
ncbi:uncharacterized protein LOC125739680 isoform X2 [Brienomyrus brachyistius]|uniref:uncharacterized protein LOC125739680 isoform X2 n=1 Tax=Brienomyrus brachyistius TaxID=42636 RepID=UPI0020B19382|nr:uncharacterized protein LOC125739680 isoform X2 [Brienomyrus brachyistius]